MLDETERLQCTSTCVFLDIEVACYGYEGIDAVKAALKAGESSSTEEIPLKVISRFLFDGASYGVLDKISSATLVCHLHYKPR